MSQLPKIDRQREHQANERTFLAWVRTCIALIGFGFAIARFGLFVRQLNIALIRQEPIPNPLFTSENLGICLVIFGMFMLGLATWRYNQAFWQIEQGNYQPNRLPVWVMTGAVMVFGLLSIPLLLLRNPSNTRTPPRVQPQPQARNFR
jgi:putative membrane protein